MTALRKRLSQQISQPGVGFPLSICDISKSTLQEGPREKKQNKTKPAKQTNKKSPQNQTTINALEKVNRKQREISLISGVNATVCK